MKQKPANSSLHSTQLSNIWKRLKKHSLLNRQVDRIFFSITQGKVMNKYIDFFRMVGKCFILKFRPKKSEYSMNQF